MPIRDLAPDKMQPAINHRFSRQTEVTQQRPQVLAHQNLTSADSGDFCRRS
jgi:hypothetical protein